MEVPRKRYLLGYYHLLFFLLWNFVKAESSWSCVGAQSLQSCWTLCDPMDCSPPGSSVHGIFPAGILEWVAIPYSKTSSWPKDRIHVSCIAGRYFTSEPPGKPNWSLFSTCKLVDGSLPGSSVVESACQHRRRKFDSWVRKIPHRRKWQPTPVFWPDKSQGQRRLASYISWSCKRVKHHLGT